MGLLDDLLGSLGEGAGQGGGQRQAPPPAPAGGGMGGIMAALLPVVLSMLASRGGGSGGGAGRTGGGLEDILGQVLGGGQRGGGGGLSDLVAGMRGGGGGAGQAGLGPLGGLLEQMQQAGFGEQARSWVGTGQNMPISPDAVDQIFGQDGVEAIARRAGLTPRQASEGLSELLPEVVDRVTPGGRVPDADQLTRSVDDLVRRLGA
jgi:uncharacterized protein YidB (DUF937 family)